MEKADDKAQAALDVEISLGPAEVMRCEPEEIICCGRLIVRKWRCVDVLCSTCGGFWKCLDGQWIRQN